ncbi:MAG: sn-glycerol-1-phosphate dehydrogenase [Oscillospiraceae bacterium]|nr:sn-glycerol-1-phosphate dehydrogenase [Oscillospiraceae bacterium]
MAIRKLDLNIKNPCSCGKTHDRVTKNILIGENMTEPLIDFIRNNFGNNAKGCIICDKNTYKAAKNMIAALENAGSCEVVKLDINSHHASESMLRESEMILDGKSFDYFIAAGSGTIHDITRVAAYKRNAPFISYPTAPSVDGFVSGVAPITTDDGMKITLQSSAPVAMFADIDVLSDAPKRLAASGVGDILGKYTALADWRIANLLTGEYICEETVKLEYAAVKKVTDSIVEFGKNKDAESYRKFCADLLEALTISGMCMQYTGNSRPASGGEHHIAHFFEMGIILSTDCLHGENVGIGSILCADLYHRFAESGNIKFTANYGIEYDLLKKYYKNIYDEIIKENAPNSIANVSPENFYENLENIKNIIAEIPSKDEFINLLNIVDGVKDINGIKAYDLKCGESEIAPLSLRLAPYIRNRLTLLKLMRCIEI